MPNIVDRINGIISPLNVNIFSDDGRVIQVTDPQFTGDRDANIKALEEKFGPQTGLYLRLRAAVKDGLLDEPTAMGMYDNYITASQQAQKEAIERKVWQELGKKLEGYPYSLVLQEVRAYYETLDRVRRRIG